MRNLVTTGKFWSFFWRSDCDKRWCIFVENMYHRRIFHFAIENEYDRIRLVRCYLSPWSPPPSHPVPPLRWSLHVAVRKWTAFLLVRSTPSPRASIRLSNSIVLLPAELCPPATLITLVRPAVTQLIPDCVPLHAIIFQCWLGHWLRSEAPIWGFDCELCSSTLFPPLPGIDS